MDTVNHFIFRVRRGFSQLLFPNVCVCCGQEVVREKHHICAFCISERFEPAGPENSSAVILPAGVTMQFALWTYDKGGMLQGLMHNLKYDGLTGIGYQLGKALGRRAGRHSTVKSQVIPADAVLIPVPLHYLKFRKRGFNQAFHIARGIQDVLPLPICSIDAVRRTKYTQSQTGFTLQRRISNMENAFSVSQPQQIAGKTAIIIDDVFTTGSTSFELAKTLKEAGAASIMIWTVAQA